MLFYVTLKRGLRRVKTADEEGEGEEVIVSEKIDFTRAIKMMAKIFYERECSNKEGPIHDFDEMQRLLQEIEPSLKGFFDQLYLAAQLFERNGPYEEINGGIHVLSSCFK